jgi:hypothetical protein
MMPLIELLLSGTPKDESNKEVKEKQVYLLCGDPCSPISLQLGVMQSGRQIAATIAVESVLLRTVTAAFRTWQRRETRSQIIIYLGSSSHCNFLNKHKNRRKQVAKKKIEQSQKARRKIARKKARQAVKLRRSTEKKN